MGQHSQLTEHTHTHRNTDIFDVLELRYMQKLAYRTHTHRHTDTQTYLMLELCYIQNRTAVWR